ncbi:alpha/beta fold hydrolase [Dyella flagellata]|uniref:Proline iminopeptidase n=1 Tax=Dyella flagellata TaxID=1867833 RepID=A0ABQ5XIS1_9GAMM|nr:alpha/beta hydrolase [Dyella flagellata]GLQ90420.1 proline iminopeptidase [Dyella flagellata]
MRFTWLLPIVALVPLLAMAATSEVVPAQDKGETMTRTEVTRIIANANRIVAPNGVQELVKVPINGIDQWLSIRGRDRRNPILLVLHGGPGSPNIPDDYLYQSPWEDYFTVVQWDQRGAGKTYAANAEQQMAPGMTVEGMTDDAAQVVQYLRTRFDKQKIFLMGHSWGTVLGTRLAQQHPDWFYAYIGVGQVVNVRRNEELGYAFALQQAKASGNAAALKELQAIAPYPGTAPLTLERLGVRSKWEMYYGGLTYGRQNLDYRSDVEELSPDYSLKELDAINKGGAFSIRHLKSALIDIDFDNATRFGCPVILFVGAHDETTSHVLAEQWFDKLQAPSKHLVMFADSAHMVMEEQPGRFLMHLVDDALPLAQKAGDAAPAEVARDR